MDIQRYLERIGLSDRPAATVGGLKKLQVAHLVAVPFENLSIHIGEPIILNDLALYEKIVTRRRGGFCYELNGLFAALLRGIGFKVTMLSAAVKNSGDGFGPDFDHMALMVELEEWWLVDVGFGDSFREPLRLDYGGQQMQGSRAYRIETEKDCRILWQRDRDQNWAAQYRFGLAAYAYEDYEEMCRYHQTSPESHFTQRRICSRATPEGRITLSDRRLIITRNGQRHEQELEGGGAYEKALRDHFGIVLAE